MDKNEMKQPFDKTTVTDELSHDKKAVKLITLKIKKHAEEHSTLFIAICSVVVSLCIFFLKLCFYSYKIGSLYYLGVSSQNISMNNSDGILVNVFYCIAVSCIMVFGSLIGYLEYRKRRFIKCFVTETLLSALVSVAIIFRTSDINEIMNDFNSFIMLVTVIPLMLSMIFNGFIIAYMISPFDSDKIIRIETKIEKLNNNKKSKWDDEKIEQLKADVEALKNPKITSLVSDEKSSKKTKKPIPVFVRLILPFCMAGLFIVSVSFIGYNQSAQNNKYSVVDASKLVGLETSDSKLYAVIFDNNDCIILSPCIEKENTLTIDNSVQLQVKKDDLILKQKTYKKVNVISNSDSFRELS